MGQVLGYSGEEGTYCPFPQEGGLPLPEEMVKNLLNV
jgi:hypothetical protein